MQWAVVAEEQLVCGSGSRKWVAVAAEALWAPVSGHCSPNGHWNEDKVAVAATMRQVQQVIPASDSAGRRTEQPAERTEPVLFSRLRERGV